MPLAAGPVITLDDRPWFEAAAGWIGPAFSERAFANIYLFRQVHHYTRRDDPLPHIRGFTYDRQCCVLPLFDPVSASAHDLARILGEACLFPIDGRRAAALAGQFTARANDDDADYIFAADEIATLARVKERRRQADHFAARHRPRAREIAEADTGAASAIVENWLADVARPRADTDADIALEAIALRGPLSLFGLIVHTGEGEPAGFLLASALSATAVAIHFAKGRRCFEGVFPYMFRAFAQRWSQYRLLNFEQDLGKPGFRQAKRAYAPLTLTPKYRLFLRR